MCNTWESHVFDDVDMVDDRVGPGRRLGNRILQEPPYFAIHQISLSKTMIAYFERNGAPPCPPGANPAEWMLEAIGAAPGSITDVDWYKSWRESPEFEAARAELQLLKSHARDAQTLGEEQAGFREFAAPFSVQLFEVTHRVFQQYWRTPSYIYSKASLCTLISLFIGFAFFNAPNTIQGLQNQTFSVFNLLTVFGPTLSGPSIFAVHTKPF